MAGDQARHLVGTEGGVRAEIGSAGHLLELRSGRLAAAVAEAGWYVEVDGRTITAADAASTQVSRTREGLRFAYAIAGDDFAIEVDYRADDVAVYRSLTLRSPRDIWIDEIGFRSLQTEKPAQWFEIRTFHEAGFGACGRNGDVSVLTGIQNPQVVVETGQGCAASYRPAMQVRAGEAFTSSPQFIALGEPDTRRVEAVALRSRVSEGEHFHRGRFREPSADRALSPSEIRVLQAVVRRYMQPLPRDFKFILYTYWLPLPRLPTTEDDVQQWLDTIDNFADLGGDLLLAVPLTNPKVPTLDPASYWELEPAGSHAERIMQHARSQGLSVGYYMGVAAGNLPYSNAPALGMPEGSPAAWKKINRDGSVAMENCLAHAEYAAWLQQVTRNTIERYRLAAWSWDPGPGHGRFCHAAHHGHRPGEGAHLGWLRSQTLIGDLHRAFGDLHVQGFYGQKEDGTWGQRGFSQHEGYWEQQVEWGASIFPDASTERQNGNGIREQAWNSLNFRFLPAELNHALAGRMTQMCMDGVGLANVLDHWGWEFGLKSAIATGGRLITATLPPPDAPPEIRHGYRAWVRWARDNWARVRLTRTSGAPVGPGHVDIFTRVDAAGGVVFLSNPDSRARIVEVDLSGQLPAPFERWGLCELNPEPGAHIEGVDGASGLDKRGAIRVVVPPLAVIVASAELLRQPLSTGAPARSPLRSHVYPLANWIDADDGQPFVYPNHAAGATVTLVASVDLGPWHVDGAPATVTADGLRRRNPAAPDLYAYVDPARVYLLVPLRDPTFGQDLELTIDGTAAAGEWYEVTRRQMAARFPEAAANDWKDIRIIWMADITDRIPADGRFSVGLKLKGLAENQFLGPWLQVPSTVRPQASAQHLDGAIPSPSSAISRVEARLESAELEGPLSEYGTFRIRARVSTPDTVDAVFASTITGAGVMFDLPLEPLDRERTTWEKEVRIGRRAAIILDPDYVTVWVRSVSGHMGNALRVPIEWRLPTMARERT